MSIRHSEGGWDLELEDDTLVLRQILTHGAAGALIASAIKVQPARWHFAAACIDAEQRLAGVALSLAARPGHNSVPPETTWSEGPFSWVMPRTTLIGASEAEGEPAHHFNGKIDSPRLFDRADIALGTPSNAVLVARATGFSDTYQGVVEDITTADSRQGGSVSEFVRSEIIFMATEAGGAVFSLGSIAWCGSLASNDGKNDVAKATRNVLERFADPKPFPDKDGRPNLRR